MHVDRNLIRLRSTGAEQGGFHTEQVCCIGFQFIHRWILPKHIVAHLRFEHGFSHFV